MIDIVIDHRREDLIEIMAHPKGKISYIKLSRITGPAGDVSYRAIYKEEREDGSCYDYTASVQLPETDR